MNKLIIIFLLSIPLFSGNLELKEGFIAIHTEMLIDKTIDPLNSSLQAELSINKDDFLSIKGKFWIEMKNFVSDNTDRDKEMHLANDILTFPLTTFALNTLEATAEANIYILHGDLNYFKKTQPFSAKAEIIIKDEIITIKATSSLNVSEYGVEMPCLLFMCVEDKVDIFVKAVLEYK